MKLTIVVIVYNECKTIKQAIDNVRSLNISKEIIVIDNCSNDGTAEIINNLGYKDIEIILQSKNYGVGKSYELGIEKAKGEYIFIQHADLEYDYNCCLQMIDLIEEDNLDAVFGSRVKTLLKEKSKWQLIFERPAYLASFIATHLINRWYGYSFTDVIGAELYRKSSIMKIKIDTYGPGFKFEHVSKMCKNKMKIGEINVDYRPREINKNKKIKPYNIVNALVAMFSVKFCD